MTAALHLSPLVAAGLVHGPIDVYESSIVKKKCKSKGAEKNSTTNDSNSNSDSSSNKKVKHQGGKQSYPGSGAKGRDICVGIWSTAWWPFLRSLEQGLSSSSNKNDEVLEGDINASDSSLAGTVQRQKNRQSYKTLLQDLEACGSYVQDVGYRTPNGGWLVKSELNASPFGITNLLSNNENKEEDATTSATATSLKSIDNDDPALLFVREKDLLSCLRNAIKIEQRLGTVKYHSGVKVDGIENVSGDLGSLVLQSTAAKTSSSLNDIQYNDDGTALSQQYHLIIAADGLYSPLRSRFAGHASTHATGTGIESSTRSKLKDTLEYKWEHSEGQREATQVEDREYIVFRGNAPMLDSGVEDGSGSFQTWGEERSMRFAAVPFRHETEDLEDDDDEDDHNSDNNGTARHYSKSQSFISKKKEDEVWFATSSDKVFVDAWKAIADSGLHAEEQKRLLLEAFGSWHKPVKTLIETTPAKEIMYELAIAHRHNAGPVFDVARIMEFEAWQERMKTKEDKGIKQQYSDNGPSDSINGRGPALVFIGDAMMTVDPVLAQGFTIAMESGASLVQSIESILVPPASHSTTTPNYQPKLLRRELTQRHHLRERRILQLLRSTELVQRLAQPQGPLGSAFATWIVRPVVKLCPEVIKKHVFDFMIRYSLGLTGK